MSFLDDLATLDVVTVTGDINIITKNTVKGNNGEDDKFVLDFKAIFGRKDGKATINGKMRVIAATHVEIDKDTLTFIASDIKENERELLDMHLKTVTAASEARANIVARLNPLFKRGNKAVPGTSGPK